MSNPRLRGPMRKLLLSVAVLSVTAVPLAGCGNDDEAAAGAAELAPAGAAIYGEFTVKPEGDQKAAVDALLARFPGGGQAGDKLKALVERSLRESDAGITFEDDIEPWLGGEAGFFASGLDPSGDFEESAGLVATEDEDKAEETLEKSAEGELRRKTYKDVEYLMDESEGEADAAAVFDGFVVLGNEAGVKAAIDATESDSRLSDNENFKNAVGGAAADRLGLFYFNSPELARTIQQAGTPLPDSFKRFLEEPFVATLDADDDGVLFEATIPEQLGKALTFFGRGGDLLPDMPADSWLALGQADLGGLLDFYVDAFAGAARGRDAVAQQFQAATGLDLQRDVIDWMADSSVFVRGTRLSELDGALVIETSDEAASGRFIAGLERLAKSQGQGELQVGPLSAPGGGDGFTATGGDVPKPVHVFQRGGRVVFAYGDAAARDAVDASDTLGDSQEFTATRDSLGDYYVSFYLLMQPILDLVESTGADTDAGYQDAKPYLEAISALVGGTSGDGDDLKSALKLVVK
jgi:Protein of unknown function (DUF3352)